MADPISLSKPYQRRDDAAIGGFKRVLMNSKEWETKEFAFWVILKVNAKKVPEYFYTAPESDGSAHGVKLKMPVGHLVRAYCHTHPKSISTGNFSSGDREEFLRLQKLQPGIVWYLLSTNTQLRLAEAECDFMEGKSVDFRDSVSP